MKKKFSALILVGGFGTRIRHVIGNIPKPLAIVNNKPFLHWVLKEISRHGVTEIFLLSHYKSDNFKNFILGEDLKKIIKIIEEEVPLGTGGSVVNFILKYQLTSTPFLLLNGDSILINIDIEDAKTKMTTNNLDGVIFGLRVDDSSRYGSLIVNEKSEIIAFEEKRSGSGLINAGIYLLKPDIFKNIKNKTKAYSMEKDLIPDLILRGKKFLVIEGNGPFIDIGIEKSLMESDDFILNNFSNNKKQKNEM